MYKHPPPPPPPQEHVGVCCAHINDEHPSQGCYILILITWVNFFHLLLLYINIVELEFVEQTQRLTIHVVCASNY